MSGGLAMADEDIGVELMRLHHLLKAEADPLVRAQIRERIEVIIGQAQDAWPASYAGTNRNRRA